MSILYHTPQTFASGGKQKKASLYVKVAFFLFVRERIAYVVIAFFSTSDSNVYILLTKCL